MRERVEKIVFVILCVIFLAVVGVGLYKHFNPAKPTEEEKPGTVLKPGEYGDSEFNIKLIKTTNSTQTANYLISPYSIEIALSMLKEGARGNSEKQIKDLIGERTSPVFKATSRISVTNGAFIKLQYKDDVSKEFYNKISNYDAELLYDTFETPAVINNWVNEKTYGMIPSILNDISPDFVLGLANAVAIDVEWDHEFECPNTKSEQFKDESGTKSNVEMMHNTFSDGDAKYFETDDAKGIVLPYNSYNASGEYDPNGTRLEFIGILPNKTVNEYIDALTYDKLNALENRVTTTKEADIVVGLPRFSYSFDLSNFMEVLQAMGIKDVFDPAAADFSGIMTKEQLYVDTAIHKTYIDLNERGTKAAAVTYFGMDKNAMPMQKEKVSITFNRPFVYMIRDSKTKEILFFGVVREPNLWKGSTCKDE